MSQIRVKLEFYNESSTHSKIDTFLTTFWELRFGDKSVQHALCYCYIS